MISAHHDSIVRVKKSVVYFSREKSWGGGGGDQAMIT